MPEPTNTKPEFIVVRAAPGSTTDIEGLWFDRSEALYDHLRQQGLNPPLSPSED